MICNIMKSFYAPWMGRPTQRVELMAGEREALEGLRKRQRSARSLAFRAGIILVLRVMLCAETEITLRAEVVRKFPLEN
jgi:predicted nucleic acid-binding Zn ribbon protein